MIRWFFLLLALFLTGCAEVYDYELYYAEPELTGHIGIYIQPDADLVPEAVLRGCQLWGPEGADCELVPSPSSARVDVWVDHETQCHLGPWQNMVANSSLGKVTIYADCLHRVHGNDVSNDDLAVIVGHEIGHLFGMQHVPLDCEHPERSLNDSGVNPFDDSQLDSIPYDQDGNMICGPAIMNPEPFMDFTGSIGETTVDHAEFLVRDRETALF